MKKFILIIVLIFMSIILIGQEFDEVYYKPGKDTIKDTVYVTNNYYYDFNNDGICYTPQFHIFYYPFYYTSWYYYPYHFYLDPFDYYYPYYYGWGYSPYFYGWNYYNYYHPYYYWNYWTEPHYYGGYGNYHHHDYDHNTYYGPRHSIGGNSNGSSIPPISRTNSRTITPKYEKPPTKTSPTYTVGNETRKTYRTETLAKPKTYNPPSSTTTRSPREYTSPRYDDRTPKYWNDFNSMNKPVYRERDYNRTPPTIINPPSKMQSPPKSTNTRGNR